MPQLMGILSDLAAGPKLSPLSCCCEEETFQESICRWFVFPYLCTLFITSRKKKEELINQGTSFVRINVIRLLIPKL